MTGPPSILVEPVYDLVYGFKAGLSPKARLIVDTDARRLADVDGMPTRCAELADLVEVHRGALHRIALTVFPFTSKLLLRRDIAAAARLLDDAGTLRVFLSDRRIQSAVRRELKKEFLQVETLGASGFRCRMPSRNDSEASLADATQEFHVLDPASGRTLSFRTMPGLFSHQMIDPGTRLLLDLAADRPGDFSDHPVLDIGCGYGALGCILAARGAHVTMVDSDYLAVKMARANLAANGLDGTVLVADAASALPEGRFGIAVSNPPTHAGGTVLQAMFALATKAADTMMIVVRDHLNYEKWLTDQYGFSIPARRDGYKVVTLWRS